MEKDGKGDKGAGDEEQRQKLLFTNSAAPA